MMPLPRWLPRLVAALLLALLAGCGGSYVAVANQEDFHSFEHPFTDEAEARVRRVAERACEQRKLMTVRASRNCTMSKCFTTFHCVDEATAAGYAQPPLPAPPR